MKEMAHRRTIVESLEERRLLTYTNFAHPGILSTDADFQRMHDKVAANAEPWLSGWNKLLSSGWAHLGMQPGPQATITRGDTNNSYIMWSQIDQTFNSAMIWKVTGDTRYADQAVSFLNAWASVNTTVNGNSNVALALGLYGFQWANVAEIMRTYSGWAQADQTKFQNYLLNVFVDGIHNYLGLDGYTHWGNDPAHYWANWDLCNIGALMAIGVFCDRHDLYNEALNYVYNGVGNGAFDKVIYYLHPGNMGQGQEAGRDQGHASLDFALLGQICQMAWNQGDDLFSYKNNIVLSGVEYLAKYAVGNNVPFVPYQSTTSGGLETAVAGPQGLYRPIFELFYNHYVTMEGLSAPYTTQALMQHTRPEGDWGNGDEYAWGTLLFALDPDPTVHVPQNLVGHQKGTGNIELSWWGGANDTSFNVYRATIAAGPFTQIASGLLPTSTTYTDRNLPAGTYYYKVTGVSGLTETTATNVVQAISGNALVGQLKFDESSGTTASDSTGNGITGTLNGGASFVPGQSGNAISLNGSNGYVSLPAGAIANVSDFTIATWVYLNGAPQTWARIFDFGDSRADWMFLTAKSGTGNLEFSTGTAYNWNKQTVSAPALANNQWVHVAVTFTNRLATIYVNGIAVASNANMDFEPYEINGGMPNSWIGRSQYSADPYLNGKIDDFRIYSGTLPAGQIYTLATGSAAPSVPAAPASFTATSTPGTVNLNWSAVSGATSYSVYRATSASGPFVPIATLVTGTTYSDAGLLADLNTGTPYYYEITAANNGGEGASVSADVTALPPSPLVPTTLVAKALSASSISLSWTAGANDASYKVYRSTMAGGPYTLVSSGLTAPTFTDTGRTVNTTYYYVVTGVNISGETSNSNESSATPTDLFIHLKFDDGSGITASDQSGNGWNGTLVNAPTWTSSGRVNSALTFTAGSNQYVTLPSGVVAGQTAFTISAWVNLSSVSTWARIFDFGTGSPSNTAGSYMFLAPKGGSNVVRFAITTAGSSNEQQINGTAALPTGQWTHVAVTWSNNVGILYVNSAEVGRNSNMTLTPSALGTTTQNYIGKSQWNDPYLNGTVDDFRMYAHALTQTELRAMVTTTIPAPPTGLSAASISSSQINLTWSARAGATNYHVYRGTSSSGPFTEIGHGTNTAYQDTGLVAGLASGTTYYYAVSAENAAGEGAQSEAVNATILPPPPDSPTMLNIQVTLSGTLVLSWDAAANATYTISRATSISGPYATVASGITTTSYTDTGLTNGTTYYYTVTSVNASGEGTDSPGNSAAPTEQWERLKFEETNGTTANDATVHGLNGTLTNGPVWTSSGKMGRALQLDGVNDYVALPTGVVNDLTTATISAWVYLNSVNPSSRIFDFGSGSPSGTTGSYMFLSPQAGTSARFAITLKGYGSEQNIVGNGPLATNQWIHVAVVLNGSTGTFYVNGVQVGQNTSMTLNPTSLGATTQNYIGRSQFSADSYLNGRVDDFRIYSRALSASEITTLAGASVPVAPMGLTATAGDQQATLNWNASSGAQSYIVKRATTSGGPYQSIATNVTTTSFTDTGLTDGVTYYYVVAASNVVDASSNSTESTATPAAMPGDANHDGIISSADFTILAQNFNTTGASWEQGDFNGDHLVNALDFNALASNFGRVATAPAPIQPLGLASVSSAQTPSLFSQDSIATHDDAFAEEELTS